MRKIYFLLLPLVSLVFRPGYILAAGELPSIPSFSGGTTLIAAAGTVVLALAVGIVIFRRIQSVFYDRDMEEAEEFYNQHKDDTD